MTLYYMVTVQVDRAQVMADNPPEDIVTAVQDELLSAFGDSSVRHALGVVATEIRPLMNLTEGQDEY